MEKQIIEVQKQENNLNQAKINLRFLRANEK